MSSTLLERVKTWIAAHTAASAARDAEIAENGFEVNDDRWLDVLALMPPVREIAEGLVSSGAEVERLTAERVTTDEERYADSDIYECQCGQNLSYAINDEGEALDGCSDLVCLDCALAYTVDMDTGALLPAASTLQRQREEIERLRADLATAHHPLTPIAEENSTMITDERLSQMDAEATTITARGGLRKTLSMLTEERRRASSSVLAEVRRLRGALAAEVNAARLVENLKNARRP